MATGEGRTLRLAFSESMARTAVKGEVKKYEKKKWAQAEKENERVGAVARAASVASEGAPPGFANFQATPVT